MYFAEAYLILTVATAGFVCWKGDEYLLRAVLLILIQWTMYNGFKQLLDSNVELLYLLTDIALAFFFYANWYFNKRGIFLALLAIMLMRSVWHVMASILDIPDLRYVEIYNALYITEILSVWGVLLVGVRVSKEQ